MGCLGRLSSLRRHLASEVDDADPQRSFTTKRRQWAEYQALTEQLTNVADGIVAAGLRLGGKSGKALNQAYENLQIAVREAYPGGDAKPNRIMLDAILDTGLTPTVSTDYDRWKPLHWILAVPDVMERGGFDAVIGNPPFLGGQKLTGSLGTNVRDWFVNVLAGGQKGSADLVAYFFLRAMSLLTGAGTLGLDRDEHRGPRRHPRGRARPHGRRRLHDHAGDPEPVVARGEREPGVRRGVGHARRGARRACRVWLTMSRLRGSPRCWSRPAGSRATRSAWRRTPASHSRAAYVLGMGFVLDPDEAAKWIDANRANAEVLFPYLNGEDLNSRPDASPSRWVIDFNDRSEASCNEVRTAIRTRSQSVSSPNARRKSAAVRKTLVVAVLAARRRRCGGRSPNSDEVLVFALVSKT